jgi:uncharacterized membrane protein
MKNSHLKLQSKYLLVGSSLSCFYLMLISIVVSVLCGGICVLLKLLFEAQTVTSFLFSKWRLLPAVSRLAAAVLLLFCTVLLLAPLRTGRDAWFLSTAGGKKPRASRVMFWYKPANAFKSARFWLSITFLRLIWAFIFLMPSLIILTVSWVSLSQGTVEINLLVALLASAAATLFIGLIFYMVASQRYFLSSVYLAKNPHAKVVEAIKKSAARTDGQCLRIFMFKLSFLPWFLLCVLIFPAAYVWPYYKQCCMRYGLHLTGDLDSKTNGKKRAQNEERLEV